MTANGSRSVALAYPARRRSLSKLSSSLDMLKWLMLLSAFSGGANATSKCAEWYIGYFNNYPVNGPIVHFTSPQAAVDDLVTKCYQDSGAGNAPAHCSVADGQGHVTDTFVGTVVRDTRYAFPTYVYTVEMTASASGYTISISDTFGNLNPNCGVFTEATQPEPAQPRQCCKNSVSDPISPASGAMFMKEPDIEASAGGTGFARFYTSTDHTGGNLGTGWRHTFSRRIAAKYSGSSYEPYVASADTSSRYSEESTACVNGFAQIKARVSAWENATASYSGGTCKLSSGGISIGTIPLLYESVPTPESGTTFIIAYEATRDDGQIVSFPVSGGTITTPPGIVQKLQQTPSGFTLTDENDAIELYDSTGKLLSVTSRAGVAQTLSYDGSGRLAGVSDSFGHSTALAYDAQQRLSTVTDPGSATVSYGFDSTGRLSTATHSDGMVRTYLYENATFPNAVTGLVDESNHRYSTWTYDAQGRADSTNEAGGADAVSLVYNANGSVTTADAFGAVRTFSFDRRGDLNLVSGISGSQCPTCRESSATTYDLGGFVSSRTDYNGNVTCYANDPARGLELARLEGLSPGSSCPASLASYTPAPNTRQRKIVTTWHSSFREPTEIDEAGRTVTFTHDAHGNVLTETTTDTASGVSRIWAYTYDSYGRLLTADGPRTDVSDVTTYTYYTCTSGYQCGHIHTVTNALSQTTTFNSYDAHGKSLTITDPNGIATTLTYDFRQRLTSRQVGSETTTFEYWPTGLLKKVTLPDSSFVQYTYDDAHRLNKIEDGDGNRIEYTLDVMGNRTAENVYDPSSALTRTHTRVFNTLNQLWKDVNAAGTASVTTVFGYDANNNETSIAAPLSRNTSQLYDELNRLRQITDPGTGITQFGYDANDNLVSVTDPRSKVTSYTYNGFGEVTQQVSPDTGTAVSTYDSGGNLATRTDARSKTGTYSYDALNRATSIVYPDLTTNLTYDAGTNGVGRLTGASDATHSLGFTYDAQGRVTGKTQTLGTVTKSVSYAYTNGNLTSVATPSGQTIAYGYTEGRVTSITLNGSTPILDQVLYEPLGPVSGWRWGNGTFAVRVYDTDGKPTTIDSGGAANYGYDDAFRINSITDLADGTKSWTYGYDTLDRLNSAAKTGQTIGYTYDANGNRLSQTGTQTATYTISATNNRVSSVTGAPSRTYTYDAAGNVTADGSRTYTYNDAGRLSTVTGSGITTTYVYNALGQRVKKSNSSGTSYFVYDEAGHLLGEYDGSGALVQETVWLNDIPVATLRPDGAGVSLYYVHTDNLNTPRRISRPSDNVIVWRWDSDPFGTDAAKEDPDGDAVSFTYNFRFPGQYFDSESGSHYNYFRDYDSYTGRYIESDLAGLFGGLNTYAYVGSNPAGGVDPYGLCKVDLRFKRVPGIPGKLDQYHAYVVTTEPNGSRSYFRGGPDGKMNVNSAWGNMTTESGPYVPGTKDWDPGKPPSMRLLDNDESCGCTNDKFADIVKKIRDAQLPYAPLYHNSNSVAGTMLRDSGFRMRSLPVSAPAFENQLKY
jgi:RHS repeat-associated protein